MLFTQFLHHNLGIFVFFHDRVSHLCKSCRFFLRSPQSTESKHPSRHWFPLDLSSEFSIQIWKLMYHMSYVKHENTSVCHGDTNKPIDLLHIPKHTWNVRFDWMAKYHMPAKTGRRGECQFKKRRDDAWFRKTVDNQWIKNPLAQNVPRIREDIIVQ